MITFSKQQKIPFKGPIEPLYQGKNVSINKWKDWEVVNQKDFVVVLPYFKDESYFLLRQEPTPYKLKYQNDPNMRNIDKFLTLIGGSMEEGENALQSLRREMYEESGIVLSNLYEVEIPEPLFLNKNGIYQVYPFLLELDYNSYKQVRFGGDGSKNEKLSMCVKVNLSDIDEIKVHDVLTEYMLMKLKLKIKEK